MVTDNEQTPEKVVRFEDMPALLLEVCNRVDELSEYLDSLSKGISPLQGKRKEWLNLDMLIEYLPNHPAKQTVYGWMSQNVIPYYKTDKFIVFLKSDIDEWLGSHPHVPNWWHERGKFLEMQEE